MAYQKTIWQTGDIITAQKLNNIEEGIESVASSSDESNVVIITATVLLIDSSQNSYNVVNYSHTFSEILEYVKAGKLVIARVGEVQSVEQKPMEEYTLFENTSASYAEYTHAVWFTGVSYTYGSGGKTRHMKLTLHEDDASYNTFTVTDV